MGAASSDRYVGIARWIGMSAGWIAVDFDGTLAHYEGWDGGNLGKPIPAMLERVKRWLAEDKIVKIFTARVGTTGLITTIGNTDDVDFAAEQRRKIQAWCIEHLGIALEVTATKDFAMIELWDDRAVQVVMNKGEPVGYSTRGLA
jgi:hypothetical protein